MKAPIILPPQYLHYLKKLHSAAAMGIGKPQDGAICPQEIQLQLSQLKMDAIKRGLCYINACIDNKQVVVLSCIAYLCSNIAVSCP